MFYLLAELKCPDQEIYWNKSPNKLREGTRGISYKDFLRSVDMVRIEMEGRSRDGEIAVRCVTDLRLVFRDIIRGSPVS